MPATPDRILRELTELWVSLGKENPAASGGVLRACTMTLLVLADGSDDMAAISETLAALMPEHPARSVLVRLSGAGERALSHRVYAQCWMPFGQRRQICCEQIEITVSDSALDDLPAVLLPLAAPDLPLIAWCRSSRLADMGEFAAIGRIAGKTVFDTAGMDGTEPLARLAERARQDSIVADLAWTRLTRWRETLALVFENRELVARIAGIAQVRVRFPEGQESAARYFGAWAAGALSASGATCEVTLTRDAGFPLRLELEGEGLGITLERQDQRLVVSVNDSSHCTNLPNAGDYLLLREELSIVRRDPVFERTLEAALRLAV